MRLSGSSTPALMRGGVGVFWLFRPGPEQDALPLLGNLSDQISINGRQAILENVTADQKARDNGTGDVVVPM